MKIKIKTNSLWTNKGNREKSLESQFSSSSPSLRLEPPSQSSLSSSLPRPWRWPLSPSPVASPSPPPYALAARRLPRRPPRRLGDDPGFLRLLLRSRRGRRPGPAVGVFHCARGQGGAAVPARAQAVRDHGRAPARHVGGRAARSNPEIWRGNNFGDSVCGSILLIFEKKMQFLSNLSALVHWINGWVV